MANVFMKLHVKNGYQLVHITEEDEAKAAFHTEFGLYYGRVMPFGLCDPPPIVQLIMDNVFCDLLDHRVIVYFDHIWIYIENADKYVLLVEKVLS